MGFYYITGSSFCSDFFLKLEMAFLISQKAPVVQRTNWEKPGLITFFCSLCLGLSKSLESSKLESLNDVLHSGKSNII